MPHTSKFATQSTESKQRQLAGLRPFKAGPDPRRNLRGRPKTFDHFRELAQSLSKKGEALKILRRWRDSKDAVLQMKFIEYAFGKVPDKLETTGLENKTTLILHYGHEFDRLQNNGNAERLENGSMPSTARQQNTSMLGETTDGESVAER